MDALAGSRLFAVALFTMSMPLPLLPQLIAQLFSIVMIRSNESLCACRLLQENMGRIHGFHRAMQVLSVFTPAGGALTEALGVVSLDGIACSAFLTFLCISFGLVLPMALVANVQAFRTFPGWVQDLCAFQSGFGMLARSMFCADARAPRRKRSSLWQVVLCWWFLMHFLWCFCVLFT